MLEPDLPPVRARRCATVFAEEAVEIGRVAKTEAVADLLDVKYAPLAAALSYATRAGNSAFSFC